MADYSTNKIAAGSTTYVAEMDDLIDAVEADMTAVEADATSAKTKTDFITITQAIDLDALETDAEKLAFIAVTQSVDLDAMEVKTNHLNITQAVDLDAVETKTNQLTVTSPISLDKVLESDEAGTVSGDRNHTGKINIKDFNETPGSYTVTTGTKTLDTSTATYFYPSSAMTAVACGIFPNFGLGVIVMHYLLLVPRDWRQIIALLNGIAYTGDSNC